MLEKLSVKAEPVIIKITNEGTREVTTFGCDCCDEQFDCESKLIIHRTEKSILKTRNELKSGVVKPVTVIVKPHKWMKYNCEPCGLGFRQKKEFIKHERIHKVKTKRKRKAPLAAPKPPSSPVKCPDCDKVFKRLKYLKVHKAVHSAPLACTICGLKLASDYYLKTHMRRHNKDFTHFCETCGKGFYEKGALKAHEESHLEAGVYVCDICKKQCSTKAYLNIHMQLHLAPEARKKFNCEQCSFQTFYKSCYKEHMNTHTGEGIVACSVCSKRVTRNHLKIHMRSHTGEKPEICEFCGKRFASRKYLNRHRRIHLGEKPYECSVCQRRFTQRGTLNIHMKRHTRDS